MTAKTPKQANVNLYHVEFKKYTILIKVLLRCENNQSEVSDQVGFIVLSSSE